MNEQAYKYVAELIHELYEEKLKVHRYRQTLKEIRDLKKAQSINDSVLKMINEVLNDND